MTVRDIQHHLASTLSVELSAGTISRITDAVADAVLEWQRRPLEEFYPVIYHRRDPGQGPRQSPGRLPLGPYRGRGGHGRYQARPGYLGPGRGRSLLLGACVRRAGQQGRQGRADRRGGTSRTGAKRAGECDGLTGLPEANTGSPGPQATVPTCVVHPVPCPWMRFVSYGESRKVAAALKADLHRPEPGGRLAGSDRLLRVRSGGQVSPDGGDLGAGLGEVHPVPGFPSDAQACHLSPTSWEVPPPPTRSRLRATSCARITDEPWPLPLSMRR